MTGSPYALMMLAAIAVSATLWLRTFRERGQVQVELVVVYVFGLLAALLGAKLAFIIAEGALLPGRERPWLELLVGKSVLGALLGGYLGVELGKRIIGHRGHTGDRFALVVPIGLAIGRIGCLWYGCCPGVACEQAWWTWRDAAGVARYPAPLVELLFHLAAAALLLVLHRRRLLRHQLFHVYLIAYGMFRITQEFVRATPRYADTWSPYQLLAAGLVLFGVWRYLQRRTALRHAAAHV